MNSYKINTKGYKYLKKAYEIYKCFQTETRELFENYDESITFIQKNIQKLFDSKLEGSIDLAKMFINWQKEIANSLFLRYKSGDKEVRYSNGLLKV